MITRDDIEVRRLGPRSLILFGPGTLDVAMIDRFYWSLTRERLKPPADVILHPQFIADRHDEAIDDLVGYAELLHRDGWDVGLVIDEPAVRAAVTSVSSAHVDCSLPRALARVLRAPVAR